MYFKSLLIFTVVFTFCIKSFSNRVIDNAESLETDPISNFVWMDSLNAMAQRKAICIYDPSLFIKNVVKDTIRLLKFKENSEETKNLISLSYALNMLGKNRLNSSDYLSAIQYHKEAYETALQINDEYLEALSLNMMGVVYRRKSAVKTALEYYTRALKAAEESSVKEDYMLKSIAISYEGIGGLYRMLGQYEKAIVYYKRSLKYEEILGSILGLSIDNHNIGKSYRLLGEYDSALFYHERALDYNFQLNSDFGKAICYNNLGIIAMAQNNTKKALGFFTPALKLSESVGDSTYIVNSNINLGWYYLGRRNSDSSNYYLTRAMRIAKRIGYKAAVMRGYELLSELEQIRGNYVNALHYYKNARVYSDSIVNEKNQQYLADLSILYEIEENKQTIEKLRYNAKLSKRVQRSKNIVIALLGIVALVLRGLIFQKLQAIRKNRIILSQKEDMYGMQLEMKALQNDRLLAENKQKEIEKAMLNEKLTANEIARQNEKEVMQKEIDHKNRELATAAAYAIKKGESMGIFLESIEKLKLQNGNSQGVLDKLKKDIEFQMNSDTDWSSFSLYFETVYPQFFKNLKEKHCNITNNELRLCAYLLMNMTNKEIALLLYISNDAVQKAKYRLKKKFELSAEDSLFDYLLSI